MCSSDLVADDELLWSVRVPTAEEGESVYLKAMDRKVWAFALVGLAAVRSTNDGGGHTLRLAASGVASVPWRLGALEARLAELAPDDTAAVSAAIDAGLADVSPLSGNGYKVALLKRLIGRALEELNARRRPR